LINIFTMIKKIILISLGLLPFLLQAQITINAQLPPAGLVQKDQLWNLIAINNTGNVVSAYINMSLQDQSTGQVVLSASTHTLIIDKGVKVLTSKDAQPVQYNYSSSEFSKSFLPMGAYTICYQLMALGHGDEGVVSNDCVAITIEPLSPPLLNMPEDKANLQTPYPQFNWMPPAPFNMFSNLNYDLIVAEVLPGQSSSEAIEYNIPVYSRSNIPQTIDNYPSSYPKLDTAKTYAWQVIAKNGTNYAAKTDVWTFKIASSQRPVDIISSTPFTQLTTSSSDKAVAPNGVLKIVYDNKSTSKIIKVKVTDLTTSNNVPVEFIIKNATQGENYIEYDLNKIMQTKDGGIYLAQIVDEQNEKWFIHFVVKNYKK
jgi:hypothetical protein